MVSTRDASSHDAAVLANLGHTQELERKFSLVSMLGLAFAILNTWTALSASITLALPSGGASSVIWGLIVAGICNMCLAASLAEFLSAWPTAGGQYHWAALVSPKGWSRGVSYATGWINVSGWVCLTATGGLLGSQFVIDVMALFRDDPDVSAPAWQQFLIYIGFTAAAFVVNASLTRILHSLNKAALLWSVAGFLIVSVTLLACSSPSYQPGSFVYGQFANEVGWPDGVAWMLGLLQGAFALTGFDATAHMIEEMADPQIQGPRIMMYCIVMGVLSGFFFLSCLLFCVDSIDDVIGAAWGPILQIFMDATGSKAGSTCLVMFPLVCMLFTSTALMTTSSRMTYAFARDGGMPFSSFFAKVHPTLEVPLNALVWTTAWVVIFGCVLLGSSSAFNAITAASVVALGVTYAIPQTINCLRGRKMLPENRPFKLHPVVGWVVNIVGLLWTVLTTVLFVFPPELPVTPDNMNYAVVAFGVILVISGSTWIFDGRKNYKGPQIGLNIDGTEPEMMHREHRQDTSSTDEKIAA
ncbi:Gaba permease [Geosmithia morbida]|uniref:Gaba permease n=1 Tax=Geosmithia morbida TaxID=1094350 RepID=A0A9P5CYE8_9HYPO|nr:Gaba permease [Geosmithia morbida]KAF4119312.1 Gaba permease [Geosmithia morbida]